MQEALEALEAERTGLQRLVRELLVENQTLRQKIAKLKPEAGGADFNALANPQPQRQDH